MKTVEVFDGNQYYDQPVAFPIDNVKCNLYGFNNNYQTIKSAKPGVSKDSTGYHLWNVWDRETGIFDLTRLVVGSQGTLGLVTEMNLRLVPAPKHSGTLVIFLREMDDLGMLINKVMENDPATFEGFDNHTFFYLPI